MTYKTFWIKKIGFMKYKAWNVNFETVLYSMTLPRMYKKINKYWNSDGRMELF